MRRITGTFTEGEAMNQRNDCKDRLFVIAIPGVSHKDFCTICAKNNLLCFLHRFASLLAVDCRPSCWVIVTCRALQSMIESV